MLYYYRIWYKRYRDTELGAVVTAYEPHTPDDFISALRESVTQIQTVVSLITHAYCIVHTAPGLSLLLMPFCECTSQLFTSHCQAALFMGNFTLLANMYLITFSA